MNYAEERLKEFDEIFSDYFVIKTGIDADHKGRIKSFLAKSIHQAEQEMLKKLVELYGSPRCHRLNHNKKQEHKGYEMCPVVTEISDLLTFLKDPTTL